MLFKFQAMDWQSSLDNLEQIMHESNNANVQAGIENSITSLIWLYGDDNEEQVQTNASTERPRQA